jgi:hypothetical protein
VIYNKIVATTFGAKGRVRVERGGERWSGEPLSESGSRLKTPKDSVIYHGRPPAGMEWGKGYNPPDRLIAD